MEINKPSENGHSSSILRKLSDSVYFFIRYLSGSVEEYTDQMRRNEEFEKHRDAREYALLCRIGAASYHHKTSAHLFARTYTPYFQLKTVEL